MASKKYKGKVCAYCATAMSETSDHVICRNFFRPQSRRDLPKAPACGRCNSKKAALEHYLTALLPFGSGHSGALLGQIESVRRRLLKNDQLRKELAGGAIREPIQLGNGQEREMMALPFEGEKYVEYLGLVVRGLVWHEWKHVIPSDYLVQVVGMTPRKFEQFEKHILSLGARERCARSYADGAFTYVGTSAPGDRAFSTWRIELYGGVGLASSDVSGRKHRMIFAAITGPKTIAPEIRWLVDYGSTS